MFWPTHEFFRALAKARRATRSGDYAAADRWTRLAERHLAIADRFQRLERSPAEPGSSAPAGLVMLDPKGFSPGGEPNWVLKPRRLDRAGLKDWPPCTKRFT